MLSEVIRSLSPDQEVARRGTASPPVYTVNHFIKPLNTAADLLALSEAADGWFGDSVLCVDHWINQTRFISKVQEPDVIFWANKKDWRNIMQRRTTLTPLSALASSASSSTHWRQCQEAFTTWDCEIWIGVSDIRWVTLVWIRTWFWHAALSRLRQKRGHIFILADVMC